MYIFGGYAMSATNFKTENNTFRKLMGNGLLYRIPRFQRDYSWEAEQWEDLWMDILEGQQDENFAHYMGYLVLQSNDDKCFDVIDGQQRITTISLLILAILKNIQQLVGQNQDADKNKQRLEQIRQNYIGYLDPVTLITKPKLTLNRNNNDYFQNYLIPLGHLPQRGIRASEHLLRKAFIWFEEQIDKYTKNSKQTDKGMLLAQLVEHISDTLFFTVITVTDELNAYKVFETLNARGVRLSSTDLLKNYLFSILDDSIESKHELSNLDDRWNSLVNRLQSEKFPDFLRGCWNSRYKLARQSELFKVIRKKIRNKAEVFNLIRGLEEDLDNYMALSSPELSNWSAEDKKLSEKLKIFRIRLPFSVLLSARRNFDDKSFSELLRAIVIISFRYNVIGNNNANEQERIYNQIAERIYAKEIKEISQVWGYLKPIYIDDERFKNDFANKSIRTTDSRNKKIVRFILCEIERHLLGVDLDFESRSFNIEHILPQNPSQDWQFNDEEASSLVYRLGNMVLLSTNQNRDIGNESYSQKLPIYQNSNFKIAQHIAEHYDTWTVETLSAMQQWQAKQAVSIWRVSQLSE